jgi:uncharacterized membrane protein YeaQ/YmgE (transglycosylase-associated protein family)
MTGIIIFLFVGLVAGWLAGKAMGSDGGGIVANLIIGVLGAIIGGFLFARLGIGFRALPWVVSQLIAATVGSIILLILLRFVRR